MRCRGIEVVSGVWSGCSGGPDCPRCSGTGLEPGLRARAALFVVDGLWRTLARARKLLRRVGLGR